MAFRMKEGFCGWRLLLGPGILWRMFEIVHAGEPVLRRVAQPVDPWEIGRDEVQALIAAMRDLMREAPGVGLAAPQVGVSLQVIVIEDRPEYLERLDSADQEARGRVPVPFQVLINPELHIEDPTPATFFEGCLSIPGYQGLVARASAVRVRALDDQGEPVDIRARGWYARILQHEIDHLHGTLCIDRMDLRTLTTHRNYGQYWQALSIDAVVEALRAPTGEDPVE